jgi:hypothetical protein
LQLGQPCLQHDRISVYGAFITNIPADERLDNLDLIFNLRHGSVSFISPMGDCHYCTPCRHCNAIDLPALICPPSGLRVTDSPSIFLPIIESQSIHTWVFMASQDSANTI